MGHLVREQPGDLLSPGRNALTFDRAAEAIPAGTQAQLAFVIPGERLAATVGATHPEVVVVVDVGALNWNTVDTSCAWRTTIVVRHEVGHVDADLLGNADLAVLPPLTPAEAAIAPCAGHPADRAVAYADQGADGDRRQLGRRAQGDPRPDGGGAAHHRPTEPAPVASQSRRRSGATWPSAPFVSSAADIKRTLPGTRGYDRGTWRVSFRSLRANPRG